MPRFLCFLKWKRLLPEVIAMLAKRHHMDDLEACQLYYHSKTAALVSEDSTQYYKKSAQGLLKRGKDFIRRDVF